jgi:hypothetical protein
MTRRNPPAWWRRRNRGASDRGLIEQLALAMAVGDGAGVRAVLQSDAVLVIDSGGRLPGTSTPVEGADAASEALLALMTPETSVTMVSINGVPGFVLEREDAVVGAVTAEARAHQLSAVWVVCNPDKLRHWNVSHP